MPAEGPARLPRSRAEETGDPGGERRVEDMARGGIRERRDCSELLGVSRVGRTCEHRLCMRDRLEVPPALQRAPRGRDARQRRGRGCRRSLRLRHERDGRRRRERAPDLRELRLEPLEREFDPVEPLADVAGRRHCEPPVPADVTRIVLPSGRKRIGGRPDSPSGKTRTRHIGRRRPMGARRRGSSSQRILRR